MVRLGHWRLGRSTGGNDVYLVTGWDCMDVRAKSIAIRLRRDGLGGAREWNWGAPGPPAQEWMTTCIRAYEKRGKGERLENGPPGDPDSAMGAIGPSAEENHQAYAQPAAKQRAIGRARS